MAAVNRQTWLRHDGGDNKPLRVLLPAAAGSTRAIKKGEILAMDTGTLVPAVSGKTTLLCVADQEQKAADVARNLWCILPRELDVFRYELSAARAVAFGEQFAISDSETLAYTAAGTNKVARACGNANRPKPEEKSTTNRSVLYAEVYFDPQASYLVALTGAS